MFTCRGNQPGEYDDCLIGTSLVRRRKQTARHAVPHGAPWPLELAVFTTAAPFAYTGADSTFADFDTDGRNLIVSTKEQ